MRQPFIPRIFACLAFSGIAFAQASPPAIYKAFTPSTTIPVNASTFLQFTITNPGAVALTGVSFTDTLPAGVVVTSTDSNFCNGTLSAVSGSGVISLTGATLSAGGGCSMEFGVTGTTPGVKNNSVTVTSNEGGTGNTYTATLTVTAESPANIYKAFTPKTTMKIGETTALQFTITNPSRFNLTGVSFTDTLPAGVVVTSTDSNFCNGTLSAVSGSGVISLTGATLSAFNGCSMEFVVTGTTGGVKNNSVTVMSHEGGVGNTATATLTIIAPPSITKAFTPSTIPLNGSTDLSFTITNPNPTIALTGLQFTDVLPAGLLVTGVSPLNGCLGTVNSAVTVISFGAPTLAPSGVCTFSATVQGTTPGVKNNAILVGIFSDNGGLGNIGTASVTVLALPPTIQKNFGGATVPLNSSTALQFTITNPNLATELDGVAFTDTLPSGLAVSTPNGLTGSCGGGTIGAAPGSNVITLSGATLSAATICMFSVNVTGLVAGPQTNTVTVNSTNGGVGNTSTATVAVVAPPTLTKAFADSEIQLLGFGNSTILSFTLTNPNKATPLTGLAFTDTLPSGLVVSAPNGLIGSCGGGTITANAGSNSISLSNATLAALASCTFSVNVTGIALGIQINGTSTVASNEGPPGAPATASTSVDASVFLWFFAEGGGGGQTH